MSLQHHLVVVSEWRERLQAVGLDTVESVYGWDAGTVVTESESTQVMRVTIPASGGSECLYLKKYWFPTVRRRLRSMFRETFFGTSKARREYENLSRLQSWRIPTPSPVAYGEERRRGWLLRSFLISAGIPHAMGLDTYVAHVLPALSVTDRRAAKKALLQTLAEQTRRMHERRFVHYDYFWRNLLLQGPSLDAFFLIDSHKGRCWKSGATDLAKSIDLAALDAPAPGYFSRADRLRFLLLYAQESELTPSLKELARRVLALASPMRDRQWKRVRRCRLPERFPAC